MSIRLRFAPSPTGFLHVGGLRTALFNYLYAKKTNGKLILRIEDTDQNRKIKNAVNHLIKTFEKLNIKFDEGPTQSGNYGPYFQSQRLHIYNKYIAKLIDSGNAYYCFCSTERLNELRKNLSQKKQIIKYDRKCLNLNNKEILKKKKSESFVIRMKVSNEPEITFYDGIRGKLSVKCEEIEDQILIKGDGFPTYHFANIIDDHHMKITHVMRGEEWLPSTPKHIILFNFFGWNPPKYYHLPLLLNPDKTKLSKRQGDVAVENYLQKGFISEAILNYVALLGWHPSSNNEIFSLKKLEKEFSLKRIQKSGAVFDIEKLIWINSQYIKNMDVNTIADLSRPWFNKAGIDISNNSKFLSVIEHSKKRINIISEIVEHSLPFYCDLKLKNEDKIILKENSSQIIFKFILDRIVSASKLNENYFKTLLNDTIENTGIKGKKLFYPLRIVLYGSQNGPEIPLLFKILEIELIIKRIKKYIIN